MTYIVNDNCINCKYTDCVEVCPVDCFYEGENMLVIHPDECIDCGVCEPECPPEAICLTPSQMPRSGLSSTAKCLKFGQILGKKLMLCRTRKKCRMKLANLISISAKRLVKGHNVAADMYLIASLASELIFPINYGIKSYNQKCKMCFTGPKGLRFRWGCFHN